MRYLRQSTSVDVPIGPFLDATDGITPETALTITQPDVRLKKNDAAWAQKAAAQTLTHEENGFYEVTLDATDTNTVGKLRLAVFESGAGPVWDDFAVLEEAAYDEVYGAGRAEVVSAGYVGDVDGLLAFDVKFDTRLNGVLTTLAGTPLLSIYKDNSTTEWTTTIAPTVDFDGRTGTHNARVDPTADGAFFAAGSNFHAVLTAGTVGGVNARGVAFAFSIRARAALMPTVAGRTYDVTAAGTGGLDWGNLENAGATVNLGATTVKDLSATGVAGIQAGLATAAAVATVSADVAGVPDALLKRDMSAVTGEAARSPLNALRFLRNKWSVVASTMTVTKEDDIATAWTAVVTATAGADPITAVDPA